MPVETLCRELERVCHATPELDGRVVAGHRQRRAGPTELRARVLLSASDAPQAWDLRRRARGSLVAYIQDEHANCLPRQRRARLSGPPAKPPDNDIPEVTNRIKRTLEHNAQF